MDLAEEGQARARSDRRHRSGALRRLRRPSPTLDDARLRANRRARRRAHRGPSTRSRSAATISRSPRWARSSTPGWGSTRGPRSSGPMTSAAIAGDVAMLASEVTPVLKALRANGLQVVAIHHHMTGTQPTIFFLHYWGTGPAAKLAAGFRRRWINSRSSTDPTPQAFGFSGWRSGVLSMSFRVCGLCLCVCLAARDVRLRARLNRQPVVVEVRTASGPVASADVVSQRFHSRDRRERDRCPLPWPAGTVQGSTS